MRVFHSALVCLSMAVLGRSWCMTETRIHMNRRNRDRPARETTRTCHPWIRVSSWTSTIRVSGFITYFFLLLAIFRPQR